jgi:histidyl-tRNA synthetase
MGTETESLKLTTRLRRKGISADLEMERKKLKKSLEYASKQGIPYVIVIGEDEMKSRKVKIKNMEEGTEAEVTMDELECYF